MCAPSSSPQPQLTLLATFVPYLLLSLIGLPSLLFLLHTLGKMISTSIMTAFLPWNIFSMLTLSGELYVILIILIILFFLGLITEIFLIIYYIKKILLNNNLSNCKKILWIISVLLLNFLGMLIYWATWLSSLSKETLRASTKILFMLSFAIIVYFFCLLFDVGDFFTTLDQIIATSQQLIKSGENQHSGFFIFFYLAYIVKFGGVFFLGGLIIILDFVYLTLMWNHSSFHWIKKIFYTLLILLLQPLGQIYYGIETLIKKRNLNIINSGDSKFPDS